MDILEIAVALESTRITEFIVKKSKRHIEATTENGQTLDAFVDDNLEVVDIQIKALRLKENLLEKE